MLTQNATTRWILAKLAVLAICSIGYAGAAIGKDKAEAFLETLDASDKTAFLQYYTAQALHTSALDRYWATVSSMREKRRARIRKGIEVDKSAYVDEFPPSYDGPKISKSLLRRWQRFSAPKRKPKKRTQLPTIEQYLSYAKASYGFVPERIPEREFKRRYAAEAVRLGLTKRQVIRVYALETGGRGTADMVAGVSPVTGRGRPISSALGYAQLLAANTINVLAKDGRIFEERLIRLYREANSPARRESIQGKLNALRKMLAVVQKTPESWSAQRSLARTSRGRGMHALNVDGDIGPWLQVQKLANVRNYGVRGGRPTLESEQLELMNLAGPGTGLEMMTPVGMKMPTSNFFSRAGYETNTVVRGRTSAELLQALGDRMDSNEKKPGAVEFAAVFDELLSKRASDGGPPRLVSPPTRIFASD